jgi:hypothetical protein
MGMSGQRHAPAALLPPGKDLRYTLYRRLGGLQSRKNLLSLPGIEPRSPGRPARSQTLYCLSYPAHHLVGKGVGRSIQQSVKAAMNIHHPGQRWPSSANDPWLSTNYFKPVQTCIYVCLLIYVLTI